jgi:glycosyltransferase involved in cell wall biosynthesis
MRLQNGFEMVAYSIVVPVYKNEANIPALLAALDALTGQIDDDYEVLFVVDGSPDESGKLLLETTSSCSFASKIIFHSRNFGAFAAIRTGLEYASGNYIAAMAADLQEPPSLIVEAFDILQSNRADVVFGQRRGRADHWASQLLSTIFWTFYRRWILREMPVGGVDIFACNDAVKNAVMSIEEPNSSLIAQLFWVGFRRKFVVYDRRARQAGQSAWSLSKRFRYMLDSIFSFSDLPIMLALWLGLIGCVTSIASAGVTLIAKLTGYIAEAGYTTLIIMITFFGSLILLVQGILGCYIWRTAENTKRRPLRIVSHVVAYEKPEQVR